MRRVFMLTFLSFVLATSFFCAQVQETGAAWKSLGKDKVQAARALKESGSILESDAKTEFFIVPTKPEGNPKPFKRWDFGGKDLSTQDTWSVDFQVGVYDGKPVFLPLRVPRDKGQEGIDNARQVLSSAFDENVQLYEKFKFRNCPDGRKCVKSCVDDKDNYYCCKYECIAKSPPSVPAH